MHKDISYFDLKARIGSKSKIHDSDNLSKGAAAILKSPAGQKVLSNVKVYRNERENCKLVLTVDIFDFFVHRPELIGNRINVA